MNLHTDNILGAALGSVLVIATNITAGDIIKSAVLGLVGAVAGYIGIGILKWIKKKFIKH